MAKALVEIDSASSLRATHSTVTPSTVTPSTVTQWLDQLLEHFSVQQLDELADHELATYLSAYADDDILAIDGATHVNDLVAALKRRVIRLAGVNLDNAFVSMAPDVIDEAQVETTVLSVEGRELQGIRYHGRVYRKLEAFKPCHRLQAYCLAQTLSEQMTPYVITRSEHRFAVWVDICMLPKRCF